MIIDSHVHFYDPHRPQGIPHPSPDHPRLYRTCLPAQLKPLAEPVGVTGVIAVECSPWVEDNQWLLDLAAADPFVCGVVGNLDPLAENFRQLLDRFAGQPKYCGVRLRRAVPLDFRDARLIASLGQLMQRGVPVDFLVSEAQLADVAVCAGRFPDLKIMVDHLGHGRIAGDSPTGKWHDAMQQLGACPNVFCKVSHLAGLAVRQPASAEVSYYAPMLDFLWETFGADRLVFGSNWPPSGEFGPYAQGLGLTENYFRRHGPGALEAIFSRNAQAFYFSRSGA